MSRKTVTVATFDTIGAAELAQLRLRDAGIPCLIAGRGQSGLPGAMFHTDAAQIRVQVVETNAKAARAVLDNW